MLPPAERDGSLAGPDTVCLLNQTHRIASAGDWSDPRRHALWLYNLHYFDDLCGDGAQERSHWHRELLRRWIAENPPGRAPGWDPYPTSLRIVNWIKWMHSSGSVDDSVIASLAAQARHLARNVEWHLLGNHLLANAKALVFAGCYFDGPEAHGWLSAGSRILREQIAEQLLPDGGHFERSPMYHAIVLEDVLDLANVLAAYGLESPLAEKLETCASAMIAWLQTMTHPEGELAYFNDAVVGVAQPLDALARYAERLGLFAPSPRRSTLLADSGYARLESGQFVALFDASAVGPDYQPGHAHADTLSFELTVDGRRVLCNSGVSTYEPGPQRSFERSTPAHNTVSVDGADSSEVWASFRVARRARPSACEFGSAGDTVRAAASHDGYRRLSGAPVHRRELLVERDRVLWIDEVTGSGEHEVHGHIPIHPDVSCEFSGNTFVLTLPGGRRLRGEIAGDVAIRLEQGTFAEGFNRRRMRHVLVWYRRGALPCHVEVELCEDAHPVSH